MTSSQLNENQHRIWKHKIHVDVIALFRKIYPPLLKGQDNMNCTNRGNITRLICTEHS